MVVAVFGAEIWREKLERKGGLFQGMQNWQESVSQRPLWTESSFLANHTECNYNRPKPFLKN